MIPAVGSLVTALVFAYQIAGGLSWNGMDAMLRFREIWYYGVPLMVATVDGIIVSLLLSRPRIKFAAPDMVLMICGVSVAAYLITIYSTLVRNSTGTPFAPIGISIAAVAARSSSWS